MTMNRQSASQTLLAAFSTYFHITTWNNWLPSKPTTIFQPVS